MPSLDRNIPLFIAFRLLFNARFYYPVFAVIQLDYGLSMSQFAILNAVWAASIVFLEVPSGALADRFGRKRMVLLASVLMVLEMALIAFVPFGNSTLVFWAWLINRLLSGAAEASASGADEALAYDSLPKEEQPARWPKVLSRLMMLSSIAFAGAMLIGAAVYDANLVNRVLGWLGSEIVLSKETVIRFPIYLTLATSIGAVAVALAMREPPQETPCGGETSLWTKDWPGARWILRTPLVFAIILAALVHDSVVRLFLTMNSEYYRLIEIPDAAFGVLGLAFGILGIVAPKIAERMVQNGRIERNYLIVSALTLTGLIGVAFAWPVYGLFVMVFFGFSFAFLNFFTSHYLNAEVDSSHRATVLSFKGLALNIGFGALSVFYAGLLRWIRSTSEFPESRAVSDPAFPASLLWLPWIFGALFALLAVYCAARRDNWSWRLRSSGSQVDRFRKGP